MSVSSRLGGVLPRGGALPRATWDQRHRWLVRLLLVGAVAVALQAAWVTSSVWASPAGRTAAGAVSPLVVLGLVAAVGLLLVLAAIAAAPWPRLVRARAEQLRATCATTGLMGCALLAVVVSGGAPEAHYLLYIAVPLVALHEAWTPYLAAAATGLLAQLGWALVPVLRVAGSSGPMHLHGHLHEHLHEDVAADPAAGLAAGLVGSPFGSPVGSPGEVAAAWVHVPGSAAGVLVHTGLLALALAGALVAWRGAEAARAATERKVAELQHQARHDALTGLLARRGMALALDAALHPAARGGAGAHRTPPLALVLFDLDRFKEVNDTLGHAAGDELLTHVAGVLRRSAEATDRASAGAARAAVARLGGDEFAALLPGGSAEQGAALARLVAEGLSAGVRVAGATLDQRLSAGVAAHPGGRALDAAGRSALAEDLLRRADLALYAAKAGDDDVEVHTPALDAVAVRRAGLARDLRRALERDDQLLLHFQPQVGLVGEGAGQVVGVEAFVRWQHPSRGLLVPGDFLRAAAESALEHRLTAKVLALALEQVGRWADAGHPLTVAVNASRHCLVRPGFTALVATALAEHRVPAPLLRLEITEDDLVQDPELALEAIAELRAMGVGVSVDDFGTGYSSLAHLRRLSVEEVKIDRSFVAGLGRRAPDGDPDGDPDGGRDGDPDGDPDEVLVGSIVGLAHRLGVRVVAEGVERPDELDALRRLGCDVAQGRLLALPAAAGPLPPLVTTGSALARPAVSRGGDARPQQPVSSAPGGRR